ncbi:acyl-CoA dehydrogenase family protein [Actinomadura graeca]|uniref:acyl-CoA dehydrogenase family protein n=1 Tax=Actinomadura graeca TaxID=2750812 RepID=UPI001E37BFB6|nr:acyl-CoA dehydrogenase family protein [Actinomadura graeca]
MFETDDHHRLREQVRAFALAEVAPRVQQMAQRAATGADPADAEVSALIARQGWIGVTIPAQYGGMDAGHLAKTIVVEELARVSGAMGAMAQASQLGTAPILHFGSAEQKQQWLPPIAQGRCLPTIAVTEPDSGSHVLGMQATARRDGGHWVLHGRKSYIGNSHIADLHLVIARTGGREERSRELSAFLVEAGRDGVRLLPHPRTLGLHGFCFGDLALEGCRVPDGNLLGQQGDGLAVAYSSSILYGRPNLAAVALGIHQAIAEETVQFARQRRRYGAPLAELPAIEHRIGLIQHRLITARGAAYQAASMLDRGQACDQELMNAKYYGARAVVDSAREAMEVHGAAALRTGQPVQRLLRDALHLEAPAGTGDIQLHRLAQAALGTPHHQPWSQLLAHLTTPRAA